MTDGRYFGANVGDKASGINVKYASDPYWGEKAAAVCWKIDSYLGAKDSYKYTIGIKDTINTNHNIINIKSDANSNSNTLYSTYPKSKTTSLKGQAPSNYAFIILKMVIKMVITRFNLMARLIVIAQVLLIHLVRQNMILIKIMVLFPVQVL